MPVQRMVVLGLVRLVGVLLVAVRVPPQDELFERATRPAR